MRWYVVRRVLWSVVATFLILSTTWGLLAITPNPAAEQMQFQAASSGGSAEAAEEAFEARRGLDRSPWARYREYMVNMATLNWGWSQSRSQPVSTAIASALPYTAIYSIPTTILSILLGLSIGLYSATNQYTKTDYAATFVAFFGYAIPNFWFAIILLLVFGVQLGWFPVVFDSDVPFLSLAMARQLVLPVIVLVTGTIAGIMRYSRAEALEYVESEFVKTAKSKGASEFRILTRHILRPAAVPLMTILVGDILGIFLAASYLVEVVFGIPGLGQLSYNAILAQDTSLVLGTTLIFTFVSVIGNLIQDVAYTVLDPRIDYGDR
ncbi:peptide/nickel transport system permease protein [Haloplanus vescus]|uniref:Peptide/nickel transport system permease protein n=1 Tax=Haloplanus vescus TaxID=555874 RepID=A0A1H3W2M4_9EURY|nr:ABC transporter permease [Haloplanus vescus]SDZ81230.1 peptide/nickel transport system permease protein [Haloplanus vescus]